MKTLIRTFRNKNAVKLILVHEKSKKKFNGSQIFLPSQLHHHLKEGKKGTNLRK
jgi:hypothetical protein